MVEKHTAASVGRYRPYTMSKMTRHLDRLLHLMGARYGKDERGRYISGFGSAAISFRASGHHEPGSYLWFESEGARLILDVIAEDRAGDRALARLDPEIDTESMIVQEAKKRVGAWSRNIDRVPVLHWIK